jgi:hypothetical protein
MNTVKDNKPSPAIVDGLKRWKKWAQRKERDNQIKTKKEKEI